MTELAGDPREWTPDQLMECIALAIKARDFEAVPHLITLLAFKDPHLAETVHESMLAVLSIDRGSAAREGAGDG
jgi:hypothetical protein